PASLWCADERTLVVFIGVPAEKVRTILTVPPAGAGRLRPPIQEFLRHRDGEGAQAWLVGNPQSWDKTALANFQDLAELTQKLGKGPPSPLLSFIRDE